MEESHLKHRFYTLLALEEQHKHALNNIEKMKHIVKIYFDKHAKDANLEIWKKVFLWDLAHTRKGKHTKFQKFWIGPYTIASMV